MAGRHQPDPGTRATDTKGRRLGIHNSDQEPSHEDAAGIEEEKNGWLMTGISQHRR